MNDDVSQAEARQKRNWKLPAMVVATIAVIVILLALRAGKSSRTANTEAVTPSVAVAQVTREDLYNEMTIPAEFRPYVEVELHAKVSGYVDEMNVDFGDKVKSGQLLATLEVPELHDQLHNAIAVQQKAEADYTNSSLVYSRLVSVNKDHPGLVAQQDLDTAQANYLSTAGAVAAAKADVEKYQTMVSYTRITAPFDGVVTKRYADPGTLIQAGTSSDTQSMPLVRVSDNYRLRLDFPVSVEYVKDIQLDQLVNVKVDSMGGKTFTGKVTRFTDRVNQDTRTMITEIEVTNSTLEIVPGMYAAVMLKVQQRPQALAVPTQAISGGKDSTVYVVNADHEIEARTVTLGLETPDKYEVTAGVKEGEWVMIGNRSLVHPGQKVEPKIISLLAEQ